MDDLIVYPNREPSHPGFRPTIGNNNIGSVSENIEEVAEKKAYLDRYVAEQEVANYEGTDSWAVTRELGTARPDLQPPMVQFGGGTIRDWGAPDNPWVHVDNGITPVPDSMILQHGARTRPQVYPF